MKKEGFKSLIVWQKGMNLCKEIYKITKIFPGDELYGLTNQIRRSAVSVPANIAEGYERQYIKEYLQFLYISRGSLGEIETYLVLALDLGYIDEATFRNLEGKRDEVGGLLFGLIKKIRS